MIRKPQWVAWRFDWQKNRWTKPPYQAASGRKASCTNPKHWSDFETAKTACKSGEYDGVGFVFTADDPYCGIDIDNCRDPESGDIAPWATDLIESIGSYAEVSPSGAGVKVIAKAQVETGKCFKFDGVEIGIYSDARYFTLTGQIVGDFSTIRARKKAITTLYDSLTSGDYQDSYHQCHRVIRQVEESAGSLWDGDDTGYESQSQADLALCNHIKEAYHKVTDSEPNPDDIDDLFRQSGLMRDKWDRKLKSGTYGSETIKKCLDNANNASNAPRIPLLPFDPFPLETLPDGPLRTYVEDVAEITGVDPSMTATSALAVMAAAIGGSRMVSPRAGWVDPTNLFIAIVQESGTRKSVAANLAMTILNKIQE